VVVGGGFTQPAFLGQSITAWVNVQNTGSGPVRVSKVEIRFDWYNTYTDNVPVILQPGETHKWTFEDRTVPSQTWIGKHSYDVAVWVAWADTSGGWEKDQAVTQRIDFAVQEPPPPAPETVVQTIAGPLSPTASSDGSWILPLVLIIGLVVVVGITVTLRKPASPPASVASVPVTGRCPQCGSPNPPENQFCGKCGKRIG
jgi:hypothetical protein